MLSANFKATMPDEVVQLVNGAMMRLSSAWLEAAELIVQGRRRRLSGTQGVANDLEAPRRECRHNLHVSRSLITVCAWCKKTRNSEGVWRRPQADGQAYTNADFTHGICPACAEQSYNAYRHLSVKRNAISPPMLALR